MDGSMVAWRRGSVLKWFVGILAVLVILGLMLFGWFKGGYNTAVRRAEKVEASWAQVENQLQRRYDLIPNLVDTVKGYAKHERELFDQIASYRTQYFQAKGAGKKINAANMMEGALSRLLLLQERYPDLKANENFLSLQDELAGTENRVAVERKRYNTAVQAIKTFGREFFGRMFCNYAGVNTDDFAYFEAEAPAQKGAPKVEF